jgi:hypothetical protein
MPYEYYELPAIVTNKPGAINAGLTVSALQLYSFIIKIFGSS